MNDEEVISEMKKMVSTGLCSWNLVFSANFGI
jgi:hypothetical protein